MQVGCYYGNNGWRMADFAALEAWAGKHDAVTAFTNWQPASLGPLFDTQLPAIAKAGRAVWLTWNPSLDGTNHDNILPLVLAGSLDGYLAAFAQACKQFAAPLVIRMGHEMNGDWYGWAGNPTQYTAWWKYVTGAFCRAGVPNVQWCWCVNNVDSASAGKFEQYWPGAGYVDWCGLDGYSRATNFKAPADVFGDALTRISKNDATRPVRIDEYGVDNVQLGQENLWLFNFARYVRANPAIQAVSHFNQKTSSTDWTIYGGAAALDMTDAVGANCLSGYKIAVSELRG